MNASFLTPGRKFSPPNETEEGNTLIPKALKEIGV